MGDSAGRRRAVAVLGLTVLVLVVVAVGLFGFRRTPAARDAATPEPTDRPVAQRRSVVHPGTWTRIAPPPLAPRGGAVGGWTGAEVLLVGGSTLGPCSGRCPTAATDGAAYDVTTGRWRPMATAPEPIGPGSLGATVGDTLVVETHGDWLAYDAGRDGTVGAFAWRRLPSPGLHAVAVTTGVGGLFAVDGRHRVAFLDLIENRWHRLPEPPHAPGLRQPTLVGYDDGVALVGSAGPGSSNARRTVLTWDSVRWRRALEPSPGMVDPDTGEWDRLPAAPPAQGPGEVGLSSTDGRPTTSGNGYVWDPLLLTWVGLGRPDSPAQRGATDVYAGRDVYILGVLDRGTRAPSDHAWVWKP